MPHPPPQNPYRSGLIISGSAALLGTVLLLTFFADGPVRGKDPLPLIAGVLLASLGGIFLFSLFVGFREHRRRMAPEKVIAAWEVSGPEWRAFARRQSSGNRNRFLFLGGIFLLGPILLAACGFLDDTAPDPVLLQLAGFFFLFIVFTLGTGFFLMDATYRQPVGRVWLTRESLQLGTLFQTLDFRGLTIADIRLIEGDSGLSSICVDTVTQAKGKPFPRTHAYPVPPDQLKTAAEWVNQRKAELNLI